MSGTSSSLSSVLVFGVAVALSSGCAAFGSSQGDSETASSGEASGEEAETVAEEVPDVGKCHTDTTTCELPEPLQPGLGCTCPLEDGTTEPGNAGG